MITCNSYFSGGGVFDLGLIKGGLTIQNSYELDKNACKVQRQNLEVMLLNAISLKKQSVKIEHKLWHSLTACTKYSVADLHGTRTGDELFLHAFRHMAIAQPDIFIVENVMGMRRFPVVMEAMTKLPNYYIKTIFARYKRLICYHKNASASL